MSIQNDVKQTRKAWKEYIKVLTQTKIGVNMYLYKQNNGKNVFVQTMIRGEVNEKKYE
ncbi:hypothetical protein [Clostridioides difficile]|uniref:hypothetical protein n=1 Tax=Clostridioides difficile TaxID=1496 RepID=UPI00130093B1|nr:hypothetical protein [Clostridioides difficile]